MGVIKKWLMVVGSKSMRRCEVLEVIIGADFLQRWKIRLDPVAEDFILDGKALEIILV